MVAVDDVKRIALNIGYQSVMEVVVVDKHVLDLVNNDGGMLEEEEY